MKTKKVPNSKASRAFIKDLPPDILKELRRLSPRPYQKLIDEVHPRKSAKNGANTKQ